MKTFIRFLIMIATLANVGCGSEGFTTHEKEIIAAGESDIMTLTTIASEQDSVLLRSISKPLTREMVASEEFEVLCRRMLATVQNPQNEGVGIAAPQVGLLRRLVAVQRFDKEGEPVEFFVNPENPYEVEFRHNANGDYDDDDWADGIVAFRLDGLPTIDGQMIKLTLRWQSFSGIKTAEFNYLPRPNSDGPTQIEENFKPTVKVE